MLILVDRQSLETSNDHNAGAGAYSASDRSAVDAIESDLVDIGQSESNNSFAIKYNRLIKRHEQLQKDFMKLQKENEVLKKQTIG